MPDVVLVLTEGRRVDPVVRRAARIGFPGLKILIGIARLPAVWWRRVMEREHLAGLGDYLLKDIGLTREDVEREARRPFWWPITGPSDSSRRRW